MTRGIAYREPSIEPTRWLRFFARRFAYPNRQADKLNPVLGSASSRRLAVLRSHSEISVLINHSTDQLPVAPFSTRQSALAPRHTAWHCTALQPVPFIVP